MNKTQVVTLRVPAELKIRLAHETKSQGVSLNTLANYFLTTQLSQIEALSLVESRISKKNISTLKSKVTKILDAVPQKKPVPEWDTIKARISEQWYSPPAYHRKTTSKSCMQKNSAVIKPGL